MHQIHSFEQCLIKDAILIAKIPEQKCYQTFIGCLECLAEFDLPHMDIGYVILLERYQQKQNFIQKTLVKSKNVSVNQLNIWNLFSGAIKTWVEIIYFRENPTEKEIIQLLALLKNKLN